MVAPLDSWTGRVPERIAVMLTGTRRRRSLIATTSSTSRNCCEPVNGSRSIWARQSSWSRPLRWRVFETGRDGSQPVSLCALLLTVCEERDRHLLVVAVSVARSQVFGECADQRVAGRRRRALREEDDSA